MSVDHYENFPVASALIPAALRPAIHAVYAFARSADDIADEGDLNPAARLEKLQAYRTALRKIQQSGNPDDFGSRELNQVFIPLATIIRQYHLPISAFQDLLTAFESDVRFMPFANQQALLEYCRFSANPVGLLMLHIYQAVSEENIVFSNQICTALQLVNFWQDIAIDLNKNRVYLPQDSLHQHNITVQNQASEKITPEWIGLMREQIAFTRTMMLAGAPLVKNLRGRLAWEMRMIIQGGLRILEKIENVNYDVFNQRPVLKKPDWAIISWRALTHF